MEETLERLRRAALGPEIYMTKEGVPDAALSTAKWSTAAHRAPLMLPACHHGSTCMSKAEVVLEQATARRRRGGPASSVSSDFIYPGRELIT